MESVVLRNPQTWNRYVYGLDNPLRFVDPTGELWTAAANGTYSWVDKCGDGQTCYQAAAAVSGNNLLVYGSANAQDITTYAANDKGYVDMSDVADHADAHFEIKDGAASYLSLDHAAGFFNTAEQYHEDYPSDSDLVVTDMGNADGSKLPPHDTHDLGRSADVRYVDSNGNPIQSATAASKADVDRISDLVDIANDNGFKQNYSARPKDFGTSYAKGHDSHLHIGATRPEQKIKPPSK
jgi:hypothetical protein